MSEFERRFEWLVGELLDLGNDMRLLQNRVDRLQETLQARDSVVTTKATT